MILFLVSAFGDVCALVYQSRKSEVKFPKILPKLDKIGFWGFGIKGPLITVSAGALSIGEKLPFLASWNPRWGIGICVALLKAFR